MMEKPFFENKIAIVLSENLAPWQELNVTAFLSSAIASHFPETMGKDFVDASGVGYPGIFRQPVMIFKSTPAELKILYKKARERGLNIGIYTKKIFETQGDQNIQAVAELNEEEQDYAGLVFYGKRGRVDKVLEGQKLHP
ncbi:MAG: DUF2000 domain-containing protein [Candidatus Aenigmarchaeota archaeon]|nr:DUF2000 domain-containing protein [Candidatus Aenigmarchaeota archaeon]